MHHQILIGLALVQQGACKQQTELEFVVAEFDGALYLSLRCRVVTQFQQHRAQALVQLRIGGLRGHGIS